MSGFGVNVLSNTSFTLKMSVFSCSSIGGAECISPNKVPISSSPLGDNTNCWMIISACCRHWGYFTMLCTHLAPPNSLKIPMQIGGGDGSGVRIGAQVTTTKKIQSVTNNNKEHEKHLVLLLRLIDRALVIQIFNNFYCCLPLSG